MKTCAAMRSGKLLRTRVRRRRREGHQSVRILKRLTISERRKLRHVEGASFMLRRDGMAVLTINEFEDTKGIKLLLANLPQVESAKGLIIDVRANGGGSTPFDLLQILAEKPIPGPLQRTRSYQAVDRARGMLPGWSDLPTEQIPADKLHHVDVPVAVLTSAMTFSAAEDFVAAFAAMHRGITVGEKTGCSTGQPLIFHLPGGGTARVCTKNDRAGDERCSRA
jgi:C-terminal processing protease CtpA/Prc